MSRPIPMHRTGSRIRAVCTVLAVALTALAGCSGGGGDGKGGAHSGTTATPSASSPAAASAPPSGSARPAEPTLPASLTGQRLTWRSCPAPNAAQGGGAAPGSEWQCATLKAPLDYAKPDGATIPLALIRAKATDTRRRIGSLVFNFGGPGGSGVYTLPGFGADYQKLRTRYDLVSFDPRGVGRSDGVTCQSDKELDASNAVDSTPDNAAEIKSATADSATYLAGCERRSGKVLPYVDTVSAARDMDLMRQVLGDRKLSYFGISYGTELGGVYAHLFPDHVGRAVFDGVVDPTKDPLASALGQAKGFQLALDDYLRDCAAQGTACPTGTDPQQGDARIAALLKDLDSHPLPTSSGRKLTQGQALNGIAAALYDKSSWKYLTVGLQEAMTSGTGNVLLALSDSLAGRDEHGHYSDIDAANTAIGCLDSKQRYTVGDVRAQLPRFRAASQVFGDFLAWGLLSCTGWPVAGKTTHPDVHAEGSAPILVVGNTGDPATPYEGARKMADALGRGVGVEVTYRGEGHGAYNSGNSCMTGIVNAYLLTGKVPADGTTCS
jgi:pimeloyl-ACP methyl ester carboxylesterase